MADKLIPAKVYRTLLGGFITSEADLAIREGARRGDFVHAGDPLGGIVAWLWRTDPSDAMSTLGAYVADLRDHNRDAPAPPITLDDVLGALRLAMPHDFSRAEYEALCARARVEVPKFYGGPVN